MHQTDHTGRSSTWGILRECSIGCRSARGATPAQPTTSPSSSRASTPGAIVRRVSARTLSARSTPTSERFSFELSRHDRHQQTDDSGFFGPSMVSMPAKSWAGVTSIMRRS
jgi:hypothetical protein